MEEISRILAQLQDVAPIVVEAAHRQIWVDFWLALALTLLSGLGMWYSWNRAENQRAIGSFGSPEPWVTGMIFCGCAAILFGMVFLFGLSEVLNPDYAVYKRLIDTD